MVMICVDSIAEVDYKYWVICWLRGETCVSYYSWWEYL
jgi:hypothetical protein